MTTTLEGFRLSPQQSRLWRLREAQRPLISYCRVRIEGALDPERLREALRDVVDDHEALRTCFRRLGGMGEPVQAIEEGLGPAWCVGDHAAPPPDLEAGPLLVAHLRWNESDGSGSVQHMLTLTMPTLNADAETHRLLVEELFRRLTADPGGLDPVQYVDVSEWWNELVETPDGEAGRAHWQRRFELAEETEPLLPMADGWGFLERRRLPGAAAELIAGGVDGIGPEAHLLAAWALVHSRLGDTPGGAWNEIAVGRMGRGRKFEDLADTQGFLACQQALRWGVEPGTSFRKAVESAAQEIAAAGEWEEYWHLPQGAAAEPLAHRLAWYGERPSGAAGGLRWQVVEQGCDLEAGGVELRAFVDGDDLELELHGPRGAGPARASALLTAVEALLLQGLSDPHRSLADLPLVAEAGLADLMAAGLGPESPSRPLEDHIATWLAAVEDDPAAGGVEGPDETLDGAGLAATTAQLVSWLAYRGLEVEDRLVILLDRGASAVAACLAALRAGLTAVPLDRSQPADRLRILLQEACAGGARGVVLVPDGVSIDSPEGWPAVEWPAVVREAAGAAAVGGPPPSIPASALAYQIFTSGSTGRPKGVMVPRSALANLAGWLDRTIYASGGRPERVAVNAPLSFDASVKQWIQVLSGRTAVVVPEAVRADGESLLAWLGEARITCLDMTPAQLRLLLDAGLAERSGELSLRRLLVGGEAVGEELWNELTALDGVEVWNVYGPTETTVDAAACLIAGGPPVLGRPVSNARLAVVDRRLHPLPRGVVGELVIAGAGLARGYGGDAARTAERFVPDPLSGEGGGRLYRSGDMVLGGTDGELTYVGRVDRQIKLRGHRIEPGEVEEVITRHPGVSEAVVVATGEGPGRRLAAYVVPRNVVPAVTSPDHRGRFELPNGMWVAHRNRHETAYLYEEIFRKRSYALHGVELPAEAAVVLDIGANIGMFTLFAGRESLGARILAFEPLPELAATLAENARLLPGAEVRVLPFGLASTARTESFSYYPRYTMMSGLASLAEPEKEGAVIKRFLENELAVGREGADELLAEADELLAGRFEARTVPVELRRLSSVIAEEKVERVDLLKIDVQRAELDVLRGIDAADWPKIRQVVMEAHDEPGTASEGTLEAITSLLEACGFEVTAEQDQLLVGTDRWNVYATRPDDPVERGPAAGDATSDDPALSTAGLAAWARRHLPAVMVPGSWTLLEALPLTRRGKIDLDALPRAEGENGDPPPAVPLGNPFEEIIAGLFATVLERPDVGITESFFELGGHSLLVTRLMSRIREAFEVDLPLRTVFEAPSVAGMAQCVKQALQERSGLSGRGIEPRGDQAAMRGQPLSYSQQRIWLAERLEPGGSAYVVPSSQRLIGPLRPAALRQALQEVVRRHRVLRTAYLEVEGKPIQRLVPRARLRVPAVDLRGLEERKGEHELERARDEMMGRPFDLATPPLVRARLVVLGGEEHALLAALHHIVSDGWSRGVVSREVTALYKAFSAGEPSPLPELPIQYSDYASWQREWLSGGVEERLLAHWRHRLEGAPLLVVPSRPAQGEGGGRRDMGADLVSRRLDDGDLAALLEHGRGRGATPFMVLATLIGIVLSHHGGETDVVVGVNSANRSRSEVGGLIGFFVNTMVLRVDLEEAVYVEALRRTRHAVLDAETGQDLPFDRLVEHLRPRRDGEVQPFFRIKLEMQVPTPRGEVTGLRMESLSRPPAETHSDLTFYLSHRPGLSTEVHLHYRSALYSESRMQGLLDDLEMVAARAAADPQVPLADLREEVAAAQRDRRKRRKDDLKDSLRRRLSAAGRGKGVSR